MTQPEKFLARALNHTERTVLADPRTTSDLLLILADAYTEAGLDDRHPAEERALLHAAAERLRSMAPVYAGRSIMPGCPAGLGGE